MRCEYCSKRTLKEFCSKKCKDSYEGATAVNQVKGKVMDKMRQYAKGDTEREKYYLKSLMTCLKFDLEERGGLK